MKTNAKSWYCEEYDFDELGSQIDPDLTLEDLYECLKSGEDVYDLLGVGDSIVRERAFAKLASVLGVGYEVVHDLWLSSDWNEFSRKRPDWQPPTAYGGTEVEVDIDDVKDNPLYDPAPVRVYGLAADIKKSGLRNAPTAYRSPEGEIVLIDGHRRLRAVRLLRDNIDSVKYATIQVRVLEGVSEKEAADLMRDANSECAECCL